MSRVFLVLSTVILAFLVLIFGAAIVRKAWSQAPYSYKSESPLGTAFTYQGYLTDNGSPADGPFDYIFTLHTDPNTNSQVGSAIPVNDLVVRDGLFTVELDFEQGAITVFDGTAYWLEIEVRPGEDDFGSYSTLSPRQAIRPTPYAVYASRASWDGLIGVPAGFIDGTDDNTTYSTGTGLVSSGTTFAISTSYRLPQTCISGQMATWNGGSWSCSDPGSGSAGWSLTGNAGTTAGTNFLGTTDDQPLELHVNGLRALLLEPGAGSSNIVGGYGGNTAGSGVVGATVGGGGRDLAINQASGNYSTVDGGAGNTASGYGSSVGGGESNAANADYSTASGGLSNTAGGPYGAVGGGNLNNASGDYATISGGRGNTTSALYAAIGGGQGNTVTDTYGTVSGGQANAIEATFASVGGGHYNTVSGAYGTIAGGGPSQPSNPTTTNNSVYDEYGTVSGGGSNTAGSSDGDPTNARAATVGGGEGNSATNNYATSGGGHNNSASGYGTTVGGGEGNNASNNYATISGGSNNIASQRSATLAGGDGNNADGQYSTVSGGSENEVAANYGTIPGGAQNYVSGLHGFAAGYQARAEHMGSFVWSDAASGTFTSTAANQFLIQAVGGVGIGTNAPDQSLTVDGNTSILSSGRLVSRGVYSNTFPKLETPNAIFAAGTHIFVTSYSTNTLTIMDVTDPDDPRLLGTTTSNMNGPVDVQVMGERAYVASELNHRLVIIDISNPSNPDSLGSSNHHLDHPRAVHVSGKYAYVASNGNDSLTIFDITDPAEILAKDFITTSLDGPSDVYVLGDYAYVTSQNNNRLTAFDISDPDNIGARGYASDFLDSPSAVHVRGSYAYVVSANANNLTVFEISDPDKISYVGSASTTLTQPRSLYVSGNYAYVAYAGDPGTDIHCGLAIFDISDPASIEVLSVTDMSNTDPVPEKPVGIYGNGRHIYVANEAHDSVTIYDVNFLQAPVVMAGNLQAGYLEATDNALVNNNLNVRGGLNVGPGGALIQGELSVAGKDDNYILGALSIGATGITITGTEEIQYIYPTHQLDVSGDARFRVNEHNNLLIFSENEDARLDFTSDSYGTVITPSASIVFDATDPITHTTGIVFYTQGPADPAAISRVTIADNGTLRPSADGVYALGESGNRWSEVHAVNGVIQTSDGRWKRNVAGLNDGLDKINQLRPVTFNWRSYPDEGTHYGLIAQEVAEIMPEIVEGGDEPGQPLGLNYAEIVPVLVDAIQEQQDQIENQAEQIASLEAHLAATEGTQTSTGSRLLNKFNMFWLLGIAVAGFFVLTSRRWVGGRS